MDLNDTSRTVEIVTAGDVKWPTTGDAAQAGGWLGNATEHDREEIRSLARFLKPGQALRITFPSVLTFLLDYAGDGVYRIHVPRVPCADHDDSSGCCDACGQWAEPDDAELTNEQRDAIDALGDYQNDSSLANLDALGRSIAELKASVYGPSEADLRATEDEK